MHYRISLHNSKGYALIISLLPIIMVYKFPVIGFGLSTIVILLGAAYALLVCVNYNKSIQYQLIIPLLIYFLYCLPKNDLTNILLSIAIVIHLTAISTGAVDYSRLKASILTISKFAAVCVIIQFALYHIFHFHLPMIISGLCIDELEYYKTQINTGFSRQAISSTLYRPSAFFLEPSHLSMYSVIGLLISFFDDKHNLKESILITIGVLLTTSGMGIILCAGCWGASVIFAKNKLSNRTIQRTIIILSIALLSIPILWRMTFFQNAIARLTGPIQYSSTQYNAIWGRTAKWGEYIETLRGKDLIYGLGVKSLPDNAYFTGLMTLIYSYGIVGVVLFYISLVNTFIRSKSVDIRLIVIIYGVMLCFADIVGFINVIFFIGIIIAGISDAKIKDNKTNEMTNYNL